MSAPPRLWRAIGPGILFAGAAVGVSHLVQATRAGAGYGLSLLAFVAVANLVKYPAFRFGPQYAAATGTSMLEGYRRQGIAALWLYAALTVATMFAVQAAVTFVTAGLALHLFGASANPVVVSAGLLFACGALLGVGQYRWLDRVTKVAVAVFTVATLIATIAAIGRGTLGGPWWPEFGAFGPADYLFLAALVGWMPSAIDVSIWQSLWTLARAKDAGRPRVRDSVFDFHIGYVGTALLALCFVVLGAAVLQGEAIPPQPAAFAGRLVDLYAVALGSWSRPVIATSAFLVMFSTTLTVADGFPRAISVLSARFRGPEEPSEDRRGAYWIAMVVLGAGSLAILALAVQSLKGLVDVATTASFLTAPLLATLNHRAITAKDVPEDGRPAPWLRRASLAGIAIQGAFALLYVCAKLGGFFAT
ncbi:MAG: divalent metal cation transporter [Myxococcota bacterium]